VSARRLPGLAARRERLGRERTAAQLRRQEVLEAEVVEQLEPLLGPAGRPVGDTAMTLWRRRQVDAYLALPPWTRARRTWVSWGFARRAVTVLALAPLWTLICLPLRMLGLASLQASQIGVAAIAAAAPLLAAVPPRRAGRFAAPLPPGGPPWRGSRASVTTAGILAVTGVCGLVLVALLAILGPGPAAPPAGRITPAARHADLAVVGQALRTHCASPLAGGITPVGDRRYRASLADGSVVTVAIDRSHGFDGGGSRGIVSGGAPACSPAP
jgi:hypothetical protein